MIEIPIGVSNHHVHLTHDVIEKLFGKGYTLTVRRNLTQKKEYACEEVVDLKANGKIIEHVRVLGPERNYNQIELLRSDAKYLGLNPPVRDSGDLANSESITVIGPKGEITLNNSCIIATKHIHINSEDYPLLNTGDIVRVKVRDNLYIENVHIKKKDTYKLEMHIDKDDAVKYNLNNGDKVILE